MLHVLTLCMSSANCMSGVNNSRLYSNFELAVSLTSLTRVIRLSYFMFKFKKREINGNDSVLTRSFQGFQETSSTFKIH